MKKLFCLINIPHLNQNRTKFCTENNDESKLCEKHSETAALTYFHVDKAHKDYVMVWYSVMIT